MLAILRADARLFVLVARAIVSHPEDTSHIIDRLVAVSSDQKISLTTSENLLKLLLCYISPVAVAADEIAELSSALLGVESNSGLSESDLVEDMENLSLWLESEYLVITETPEDAVVQTANDLAVALAAKSHLLSFRIPVDLSDQTATLFAFVKALCLHLGSYYNDVTFVAESYGALMDYPPFKQWYYGVILPYHYYYQNYVAPRDIGEPEVAYLSMDEHSQRFEYLIAPLKSRDESFASKLLPRAYFSKVILPLAVYYQDNLQSVSEWIFSKNAGCDNVADFELWDELLRTVLSFHSYTGERFPESSFEDLTRNYTLACLYFGLCKSERMSSFAQANTQAQIRDTLLYLVDMLGDDDTGISLDLGPDSVTDYSSLREFAEHPPKLASQILLSPLKTSVNYMLRVFATCCSLHSLNDLTIKKYFLLKSQSESNTQWFHKEVIQIFSRADKRNSTHALEALSVFSQSFLSQNATTMRELDQLIFENLLKADNFSKAIEFYDGLPQGQRLSPDVVFDLVSRQFWDLFESASNLDDRIGKLKLATTCLEILDTLSNDGEVSAEKSASVVKIKHLLKAIHSLKNFKLVLVKNQPVTPKQVLDKVTSTNSEERYPQFGIVSMVLEQNPKSYLAHERLYKIVNDLAIYSGLDLSVVSYPKVQSACVESALIDGNFDFAYKQTKELISYYVETNATENFNEIWLMFYQVGKYILLDWFGDYNAKVQEEKIDVLTKQREILSLSIKYTKPSTFAADNSSLLVGQFRHVNSEIAKWHEEAKLHRSEDVQDAMHSAQKQIKENFTGLLNEASHSRKQAKEKISNLFVSGLGWAIGAKR